jgi:hypothetical protein
MLSVSAVKEVNVLTDKFKKELNECQTWMKISGYKIVDSDLKEIEDMDYILNEFKEPSRNKLEVYMKHIMSMYNIYLNDCEIGDAKLLVKEFKERKKEKKTIKKEKVVKKTKMEFKSESECIENENNKNDIKSEIKKFNEWLINYGYSIIEKEGIEDIVSLVMMFKKNGYNNGHEKKKVKKPRKNDNNEEVENVDIKENESDEKKKVKKPRKNDNNEEVENVDIKENESDEKKKVKKPRKNDNNEEVENVDIKENESEIKKKEKKPRKKNEKVEKYDVNENENKSDMKRKEKMIELFGSDMSELESETECDINDVIISLSDLDVSDNEE